MLLAALAAGAFLFMPGTLGDIIEMNSGRSLEGVIVNETAEQVVLQVPSGQVTIPREQIRKVIKDSRATDWKDQAGKLIRSGDYSAAVSLLEDLIEKRDEDPELLEGIGRAYAGLLRSHLRTRRHSQAQDVADRAAPYRKGSAALSEALDELDEVLGLVAELKDKAQTLLSAGKTLEALQLHEDLQQRDPENASVYRRDLARGLRARGDALFDLRRFTEAVSVYTILPRYDPVLFDAVQDRFVYAGLFPVMEELARKESPSKDDWAPLGHHLASILQLAPNNPHALCHFGLFLESQGHHADALKAYGRALGRSFHYIGPDQVAQIRAEALKTLREFSLLVSPSQEEEIFASAGRESPSVLTTEHFNIHYYAEPLAGRVGHVAELAFASIREELFDNVVLEDWPTRCDLFLYPDRDAYIDKTAQPAWASGVAFYRKASDGSVSHSIRTFQSAPALLRNVIPHEIAHALFASYLGWPDRYDMWLHEGVALHGEFERRRPFFVGLVKCATDAGALIPLGALIETETYPAEEEIDLFYAESFFLTELLMKLAGGPRAFFPFTRAVSQTTLDEALHVHFGMDREELRQRWDAYLEDVAAEYQRPDIHHAKTSEKTPSGTR